MDALRYKEIEAHLLETQWGREFLSERDRRHGEVATEVREALDGDSGRIASAVAQLRSIVSEVAASAESIIEISERVMEADESGEHAERIMSIMEKCSFHDIAGQRLHRVASELSNLEDDLLVSVKARQPSAKAEPNDPLAHGPGGDMGQSDVDDILNG